MKRYQKIFIGILLTTGLAAAGNAAEPIIYPAQGQSQEQQVKDQGECAQWATQQTGVDPRQIADTATSQSGSPQQHQAVRGAAGGALAGVAIGAIAGDAGKGAAIGATAGGVGGAVRQRRQHEAQQSSTQQVQAQQKTMLETYDRAYGACLSGRGYTVK